MVCCASGCNQLTHVRLARVLQEGWEWNGAAVCLFCMNESVARSTLMDRLESRALLQASRSIRIRISFLLNISAFACVLLLLLKIGRYWSGGIKLLNKFEFPARTGRTLLWRIVAQTVADNLLELLTIIHCQASWCDAFFSTIETASLFQESTRLGLFSGWVPTARQAGWRLIDLHVNNKLHVLFPIVVAQPLINS